MAGRESYHSYPSCIDGRVVGEWQAENHIVAAPVVLMVGWWGSATTQEHVDAYLDCVAIRAATIYRMSLCHDLDMI